jgi:hypothetical protein
MSENFWTTLLWIACVSGCIYLWGIANEPMPKTEKDGAVIRALDYLNGDSQWFDESEIDKLPPDLRQAIIEK